MDRPIGKCHQHYRGERRDYRVFANSLRALEVQVASETLRSDTSEVPDPAHCRDDIRHWKHTFSCIQYFRLSNWWRGPSSAARKPLQRRSPCCICFRARESYCHSQHGQAEVQTVPSTVNASFQEEIGNAGPSYLAP